MTPTQDSCGKNAEHAFSRNLWPLRGEPLLLVTGCASIGPGTIDRDRFDYTTAIAESWKSQMLLNIVKPCYSDTAVFPDVTSVLSQCTVQGRVNLGAGWNASITGGDTQTLGMEGLYAERPTIAYTPLSGEKFTGSLVTPSPPASLLFLTHSGRPIKPLFELCVKSINELDNRSTVSAFGRSPDPRLQELLERMTRIQQSGAVGARIVKKDKWETAVISFRHKVAPEIARDIVEARKLMGIDPNVAEITIVYGSTPTANDEVAILTRSIMEVIIEMASQIDVPDEHVAEGRTYATSLEIGSGPAQVLPFCRVHTGKEKPAHAFAAIQNRGYWYWIDDGDRPSKVHFAFLMILFGLTETGTPPQAPLITVPVN
jgi:hypothetical protein